ncbi:hypothetical protein P3339_06295 [Microbulbifer sp. MLAF003]|uniref:hypothetical protein n=1 Tax=Microbulbifer sp. MLAF003 TaxID=3032582 RepID=UPI0024ACF9E3|nr:hypothetical protein [Microbulbifer sp. MLAF003]WHI52387.1 hypothetical protein P3339_06295 [Microbulbifer sp. MLAF003]
MSLSSMLMQARPLVERALREVSPPYTLFFQLVMPSIVLKYDILMQKIFQVLGRSSLKIPVGLHNSQKWSPAGCE